MKKARFFLAGIVICAMLGGTMAFNVSRGLNNLYQTVTGVVTLGGFTRLITYATLSPYRTFPTFTSQPKTNPGFPLYTQTVATWTTVGGMPYMYPVPTGPAWPTTLIWDDEDE